MMPAKTQMLLIAKFPYIYNIRVVCNMCNCVYNKDFLPFSYCFSSHSTNDRKELCKENVFNIYCYCGFELKMEILCIFR